MKYIFSSILEVRVDKIDLSLHERKMYGKVISIGEIFTSLLVLYNFDFRLQVFLNFTVNFFELFSVNSLSQVG